MQLEHTRLLNSKKPIVSRKLEQRLLASCDHTHIPSGKFITLISQDRFDAVAAAAQRLERLGSREFSWFLRQPDTLTELMKHEFPAFLSPTTTWPVCDVHEVLASFFFYALLSLTLLSHPVEVEAAARAPMDAHYTIHARARTWT